jgi:hypothetical protein
MNPAHLSARTSPSQWGPDAWRGRLARHLDRHDASTAQGGLLIRKGRPSVLGEQISPACQPIYIIQQLEPFWTATGTGAAMRPTGSAGRRSEPGRSVLRRPGKGRNRAEATNDRGTRRRVSRTGGRPSAGREYRCRQDDGHNAEQDPGQAEEGRHGQSCFKPLFTTALSLPACRLRISGHPLPEKRSYTSQPNLARKVIRSILLKGFLPLAANGRQRHQDDHG